jgi:hypothetical protein
MTEALAVRGLCHTRSGRGHKHEKHMLATHRMMIMLTPRVCSSSCCTREHLHGIKSPDIHRMQDEECVCAPQLAQTCIRVKVIAIPRVLMPSVPPVQRWRSVTICAHSGNSFFAVSHVLLRCFNGVKVFSVHQWCKLTPVSLPESACVCSDKQWRQSETTLLLSSFPWGEGRLCRCFEAVMACGHI